MPYLLKIKAAAVSGKLEPGSTISVAFAKDVLDKRSPPSLGDKILIWFHESAPEGLAVDGQVLEYKKGSRMVVAVDTVFLEPWLNRSDLRTADRNSLLGRVYRYVLEQLRRITDDEYRDIKQLAAQKTTTFTSADTRGRAARVEEADVSEERQRIFRLIEQRQNQGPFRNAIIMRDGPRCAITECEVLEVLEAAHIIPFKEGHVGRDNPDNGILLRADIHTLFDRGLIAVEPVSLKVWVSPSVTTKDYRQFHGRCAVTGTAAKNLECHYAHAKRNCID
jgi:hypothetical protein